MYRRDGSGRGGAQADKCLTLAALLSAVSTVIGVAASGWWAWIAQIALAAAQLATDLGPRCDTRESNGKSRATHSPGTAVPRLPENHPPDGIAMAAMQRSDVLISARRWAPGSRQVAQQMNERLRPDEPPPRRGLRQHCHKLRYALRGKFVNQTSGGGETTRRPGYRSLVYVERIQSAPCAGGDPAAADRGPEVDGWCAGGRGRAAAPAAGPELRQLLDAAVI